MAAWNTRRKRGAAGRRVRHVVCCCVDGVSRVYLNWYLSRSLVIPPLEMPFHGRRHLGSVDLSEMGTHQLRDTPVPGSEVKEPLGPPLRLDPEQPLELLGGKHKHGAPTKKPGHGGRARQRNVPERRGRRGSVRATHPLMEVRETSGPRTVDTKEW